MAKIGVRRRRRARAILDFLARRAGYEPAVLKDHLHCEGIMTLTFSPKESAGDRHFAGDAMICEHGNSKILGFRADVNEVDALLKHLLKNKSEIFVLAGPGIGIDDFSVLESRSLARVLANGDCLESLALRCGLEKRERERVD